MAPGRRSLWGFSLIELLVVLVVLGILMSVAVPAVFGARRRSFDVAAMAYLRQAVAAEEAYAGEHGDYAADLAGLQAAGLRSPAPGLDLVVLRGGRSYCLLARHRRGSLWYAASSQKGLYPTARPARSGPGSDCP